jgi:hypothetical protein
VAAGPDDRLIEPATIEGENWSNDLAVYDWHVNLAGA